MMMRASDPPMNDRRSRYFGKTDWFSVMHALL
jgi:hypothetical protein